MLCDVCQNLPADAWRTLNPAIARKEGSERLIRLLCERCGELLPPKDSTEHFLRSLSRLAGFGLAAGGSPILKR